MHGLALEHYNEGLKPLKDFIRYKSLIQELANDLDTQRTRLKSTCETLLTDLTLSDEDLLLLLDDPTSTIWSGEHLARQLKDRLQGSYSAFLRILNKIANTLRELTGRVGLDNEGRPQWTDRRAQKRCWARFTTCLRRKEHEDLIRQIARDIDFLHQLTRDSLLLETPRSHRRSHKSFQQIRDHAARLHGVLRSRWSCNCSVTHRAELRLERRDWDQPPCFRVTFPLVGTTSHFSPVTRHETEIKTTQTMTQCEKSRDPTMATVHISKNVRTFCATPHQVKTTKKSVAFAIAPAMPAANISISEMKMVQGQMDSKPEARDVIDLCAALRRPMKGSTNDSLGTLQNEHSLYEVFSISRCESTDVGTLTLQELLEEHHRSQSIPTATPSLAHTSTSLSDPRLTKLTRLQLAVTLASTSLQLCTTPWLQSDYSAQKILFRRGTIDSPFVSSTFVNSGGLLANQASATSEWSPIRNQTIFRLGVLLLELSLGRPFNAYENNEPSMPYRDYMLATRLLEQLAGEESENYICATKACIFSDFGNKVKVLDFGDNAFRRAVYDDVILPLEKDLEFFRRQPLS